jgi:hypothetical protein
MTGRYSVAETAKSQNDVAAVLSNYLERKGAVLKPGCSDSRKSYGIQLPLWSLNPLWYSKDNFIGVNPVIIYGKAILSATDNSVELLFKSPRTHYFSGFFLLTTTWASMSNSDPWILKVGLVFALLIEAASLLLKRMITVEIEKEIN